MSDEPKKASNLPFSPPVPGKNSHIPFTPPIASPAPAKGRNAKRNPTSSRKQLKNAKKNSKHPISVRALITGLFILIITSIAVTAVISPDILSKIASGEIVERMETCVVEEINSTNFFDTSCGKFEWDTERQPGTPSTALVEGETYLIKSSGIRFGLAQQFPSVMSYEVAAK